MTKNKHSSVISTIFSKPYLGILILFTLVSLLNIPVLITLWRHGFDDGTYSHAFLIPFISLYLYYLLAGTGQLQFRKKLSLLPTAILIISCYLLFVTTNAQISVGYWGALLAVFITSVTMLYRFNWYIVFPAAFLIFIFPFWGVLVPLLQNISIAAVTYMMGFTGVPTYVEAEMITIPAGVFEIAGGCSGLRYMIVSLAIGSLFIFLNIRDTKRAALFLLLTILGALLTNWIRITALILIGEYTNMESSLMEDHNTFGWYLYVPFMILLFYWGNKLSGSLLPGPDNVKIFDASNPNKLALFFLIIMTLASSSTLRLSIPQNVNVNKVKIENNEDNTPDIFYYSSKINMNVSAGNTEITYSTYAFNGEDLDGKPSYYNNSLIPNGWSIQQEFEENNWRIYQISKHNNKALVFVKYEISNETSTQVRQFKVNRIKKALTGNNDTKLHWAFARCKSNCTKAETEATIQLSLDNFKEKKK
ncbi:MAG: exosortase [Colwellia sp.]